MIFGSFTALPLSLQSTPPRLYTLFHWRTFRSHSLAYTAPLPSSFSAAAVARDDKFRPPTGAAHSAVCLLIPLRVERENIGRIVSIRYEPVLRPRLYVILSECTYCIGRTLYGGAFLWIFIPRVTAKFRCWTRLDESFKFFRITRTAIHILKQTGDLYSYRF